MQFKVLGAKRETGEPVVLTVEASSAAEAASRANRRGILVERCDLATTALPEEQRFQRSPQIPEDRHTPVTEWNAPVVIKTGARSRLLRLAAIIGATTITLLIGMYFFWIKPEYEARRKSFQDALAQPEMTPKAQGKADTQNRSKGQGEVQQTGVEPTRIPVTVAPMDVTPKNSRITGDAWVKRNDGETLAMAATEVYLLPQSLAIADTQSEIKDAIALLQIRIDVNKGQPSTSADGATAVAAQRLIDLIRPSNHGGHVTSDDLSVASVGIIEIKANEAKTATALAGRQTDASIREMQRTISSEPLWKLMAARSLSHVTTNREGKFEFEGVDAGKYLVVCRATLPALQAVVFWSQTIEVKEGVDTSVSFTADKAIVVSY